MILTCLCVWVCFSCEKSQKRIAGAQFSLIKESYSKIMITRYKKYRIPLAIRMRFPRDSVIQILWFESPHLWVETYRHRALWVDVTITRKHFWKTYLKVCIKMFTLSVITAGFIILKKRWLEAKKSYLQILKWNFRVGEIEFSVLCQNCSSGSGIKKGCLNIQLSISIFISPQYFTYKL